MRHEDEGGMRRGYPGANLVDELELAARVADHVERLLFATCREERHERL